MCYLIFKNIKSNSIDNDLRKKLMASIIFKFNCMLIK